MSNSSENIHLENAAREAFNRFRTPNTRDVAPPKEQRVLDTAQQVRFAHTQILQVPQPAAPPIQLTGYVWGENGAPTVLLVHGWEFQSGRMSAFVPPLLTAGFRVAAFDSPAHGRSEGEMSTLLDLSQAIENAATFFGDVVALVGHSFGGMASVWLLGQGGLPQVQKLVCISAGSDVGFLAEVSPAFAGESAEFHQAFREMFKQRIGRYPSEFNAAQAGRNIQIPVLIIHDTKDLMVAPAHAQQYANNVPNAKLLMTNGLGHRSILRAPEVTEAVVGFLA